MSAKVSEPDDPRVPTALMMLEGGATQPEVAAALGVATRTVRRWLAKYGKASRVAERALEAVKLDAVASVSAAMKRVAEEALASVETLVEIRDAKTTPEAERIRASIALLDRAGIIGGVKVEHGGSIAAPVHDRAAVLAGIEARVNQGQGGQQDRES